MSRPRTSALLGVAALGATLAVATALPAVAMDGPEKSVAGATTTIKVLEKETGGQYIPKGGEPGDFPEEEDFEPTVGDAFTFTSDLLQDGKKVGSDVGKCTLIAPETNRHRCEVTVTFANGTIRVDSATDFPDDDSAFQVAIVSGTGAYAGAKGSVTVSSAEEDEASNLAMVFTTGGQVSEVPSGGAAAGGGMDGSNDSLLLFGIAGLATVAGLGVLAGGRRLAPRR